MIYNFIGQPNSGKTTLANHLKNVLQTNDESKKIYLIDGDELRDILKNKDYSEEGRRRNIHIAYSIAEYLNHTNPLSEIIISLVSPFADLREDFKKNNNVIEIYLHTTNVRGKESFHFVDYQKPIKNFIDIDTTDVDEITSLNDLLNKINGFIKKQKTEKYGK